VCRCRVGDPNSITTLNTWQKKIHIFAQRRPFELSFSFRDGVVSILPGLKPDRQTGQSGPVEDSLPAGLFFLVLCMFFITKLIKKWVFFANETFFAVVKLYFCEGTCLRLFHYVEIHHTTIFNVFY